MSTIRSLSLLLLGSFTAVASAAGLTSSSLQSHVDTLNLDFAFGPVKESYWTGYPHHRRTPFAVSPDGKSAYLAYLDSSETDVHVQKVDPSTFAAVDTAVTISGAKEAGGLVAHNDGFALLTNEVLPSGTTDAPTDDAAVAVLYRYTGSTQTFKTFLGGPGVHPDDGLHASPDLNGDLVFSEEAQLYGAYFVVTAYTGWAAGHFGDSIQYVDTTGSLQTISGASSSWGCSHNTGIAFEAAGAAPFASVCAEDQGAIWLNTETRSMDGVKISNENITNGGSGEPMGGMSGSYSNLARLVDSDSYVFAWVSRGAVDLTENAWLGGGNTQASNRTNGRRVAIAQFSDKATLVGAEATSEIGAADGDSQVNWITAADGSDNSNAHVAAFNGESALVSWEEIASPDCWFIAMGCKGAFTGSYFQLVTNGEKVGEPIKSMDTFVAGDMVTMSDGRICWPYVSMDWDLSEPVAYGGSTATTQKMSFACMSLSGSTGEEPAASSAVASSAVATSAAATTAATSAATSAVTSAVASAATSAVVTQRPTTAATEEVATAAPTTIAEEEPTTVPETLTIPATTLVTSVANPSTYIPATTVVPTTTPASVFPTTEVENTFEPTTAIGSTAAVTVSTGLPTPIPCPGDKGHGRPKHRGQRQRRHHRRHHN